MLYNSIRGLPRHHNERDNNMAEEEYTHMEYVYRYNSPIGEMTLASDGKSIIGLWFDGQKYFGSVLSEEHEEESLSVFDAAANWLDIYFGGKEPDFTPPLSVKGTPFYKEVWEILLDIPYGCTMTYGEIAGILAQKRGIVKMSARAVGNAVAHNPVSVIIPCHRVIGNHGKITGYAGGTDKKIYLLSMESRGVKALS